MKIEGYVLLYYPKENDFINILSYLLKADKLCNLLQYGK